MKWSRLLLWFIVTGLAITGVSLYLLQPAQQWDLPDPLNGPLRMLHGWLALFALISFGTFLSDHVSKKWRKVMQYPDGLAHLVCWVMLILTAGLLYYPLEFWPEQLSVARLHWYSGVSLMVVLPLHCSKAIARRKHTKLKTH